MPGHGFIFVCKVHGDRDSFTTFDRLTAKVKLLYEPFDFDQLARKFHR